MLEEGYIDQAAFDAADAEPWVVGETILPRPDRQGLDVRRGANIGTAHFVEYVRLQLLERGFSESEIYGGGLRVYTTLDYRAQEAAWNAVRSTLDRPDDPEAALVAVDNAGLVRAMVAGRDFAANEFNYATGSGGVGRQPGSSMKPFVLATAVTQNISLNSRFDAPGRVTLEIPGEDWDVGNYGDSEQGILTLLDATRVSSNTAYAQLMLEIGPENVVALANRMGLDGLDAVPALVLGTEEASPLEMAGAYSTFANAGVYRPPLVITEVVRPDGSRVAVHAGARPGARRPSRTPSSSTPSARSSIAAPRPRLASAYRPRARPARRSATSTPGSSGSRPNALTAAVWMGYEPVDTNGDGIKDPRFMSDVHGRAVTGGSFPARDLAQVHDGVGRDRRRRGRPLPERVELPGDGAQLRSHDDDVDVAAVPGRRELDDGPVRHDDDGVDDDDGAGDDHDADHAAADDATAATGHGADDAAGNDHDRRPADRRRPRRRDPRRPTDSGSAAPTSWWG